MTPSLPGHDLSLSNRKRKPSPPSLSNPPSPSTPSTPLNGQAENNSQPGWSKVERRKNKKLKKIEAKAQNEKPPSLSFAGGELRKRKAPISVEEVRDVFLHLFADGGPTKFLVVENPRSILRAVLLLVPGISTEALGASDPPVSSAYPITIGTSDTSKIPAINSCYSHACPTRATGEPTKMHSVLTTVLQSPVSGEQKRKRLLERQQQKFSNDDPSMYVLDTPTMLDNGYPIPSYLGEGLSTNPESIRATSSWPAAAPTPQTREHGWVETPRNPSKAEALKIIAIDCEMCETEDGKVLARVCAVDYHSDKVVYDQLVLPDKPVIDYLTQFSGITEEQLASVTLKLADAQAGLLELIDANTIIVGHSLENDLRALKLAHPRCIDTSIIYKHPRGAPYKPGLKWLAQKWLNMDIQMKQGGHDPEEDARACLALLRKKLKEGPDFGVFKQDIESIFERLSKSNGRHGKGATSAVIDHGNPRAWHGAKATSAISCQTDDQVVKEVLEAAQNHDFVFGRLLELSQALGWTTQRAPANGTGTPAVAPPAEPDPAVIEAAYTALNTRIATIQKSLPAGTALCIMSGNGDPRLMSSLNTKKSRWDAMMREKKRPEDIPQSEWWTMEEGRLLEDATERAKRGLAFFCLVR